MRISTNQIYQRGVDAMLEQQSLLSKTQNQLATGKRIVVPSDDPIGAVQMLDLQKNVESTKRYQENIAATRVSLSMEEQGLRDGIGILQRVRDLAIQANNASMSNSQRQGLAAEIDEHLAGLLGIANTQDANGDYLFAGFSTNGKPFSQSPSGFNYAGDQGQRLAQIGPTRQVAMSDSGMRVFQAIKDGNGTFVTSYNAANTGSGVIDPGTVTNPAAWVRDTYTINFITPTSYEVRDSSATLISSGTYQADADIAFNGVQTSIAGTPAAGDQFTLAPSTHQDVFTTLQDLANALRSAPVDPAAKAQAANDINRAMTNLDQALDNFSNLEASVGARLQALDNQESINEDFILISEMALADVQDLDYAEAISLFNRQLLALQAAQQSFMRVQNLSLFNFF